MRGDRLVEVNAEVLFYERGEPVYGIVKEYIDDENLLITVVDEVGDEEVRQIAEDFLRHGDDPDHEAAWALYHGPAWEW